MHDSKSTDANGNPTHVDPNPPTIAAFSPPSASPARRSTFQVHQKSPLLAATPPRITQALSRAYPWIEAANFALGLLTWTSKDPWESFLLIAAFWLTTLYGDVAISWGGNVVVVVIIIAMMFSRRYWDGRNRATIEKAVTLDGILEELTTLNARVEIFATPFVNLLALLASEKSPTRATTRPALTTLFVRILLITPLWLALAVWPLRVLTARRVVMLVGTAFLSWHSRPAKVTRTLLWRSRSVRNVVEYTTGLHLTPSAAPPPLPPRQMSSSSITTTGVLNKASSSATAMLNTAKASPGVKFTFIIYENQRRWLGIGWTAMMLPGERASWTDEHLNPCPPPEEFTLPETPENSSVRWRWVPGEEWKVDGAVAAPKDNDSKARQVGQEVKDRLGGPGGDGEGWWYYDNKWKDGRRGLDGWGKYTRRRKWYRRAELVEGVPTPPPTHTPVRQTPNPTPPPSPPPYEEQQQPAMNSTGVKVTKTPENGEGGEENPTIRIVDVDEDGRETVIAEVEGEGEETAREVREEMEAVERERENGSAGGKKGPPPPLPKRYLEWRGSVRP